MFVAVSWVTKPLERMNAPEVESRFSGVLWVILEMDHKNGCLAGFI
jgi:hypothetical protein